MRCKCLDNNLYILYKVITTILHKMEFIFYMINSFALMNAFSHFSILYGDECVCLCMICVCLICVFV